MTTNAGRIKERLGRGNPHFPLAIGLAVLVATVKMLTAEPGHSIPIYMLYGLVSFCTAYVLVLAVYSWLDWRSPE